ncbi:SH3 domain-containing protein [Histoplasma capsulatum H143]|uniref:SH3 domain-containing protein n=1 Tax=Ajellomyces capsulatus (strain H143) TaxID=544712 RepID=C6H9L4_AJECH|nr:SH3 domain-containing protein [Histoplasma capsulatum H143]
MASTKFPPVSSPSGADKTPSIPTISHHPSHTTSPAPRRSNIQRPSSYAKNRLSTYSSTSFTSQNRSRPPSHVFLGFHSSLPYALVRDFAYPSIHPLHYGPHPSESGISTPMSEARRLSDPPNASWDVSRGHWHSPWNPEAMYGTQQLPAMAFGDGPPYSEDEDLHSPVVTTSRHRKHKSAHLGSDFNRGRSPGIANDADPSSYSVRSDDRGVFVGLNGDGSATYYVKDDDAVDDGPGGEYVTYPANDGNRSFLSADSYPPGGHRDSHFAASLHDRTAMEPDMELQSDDEISEDDESWRDASRYSRDYKFTIVSPDEEMHGKAVALFDFDREHENELPLKEGQVILVSYRHGQGWLVAEDPKTGESGLVPEEFVRLVRDIEGGLNGLNGALLNTSTGGEDAESTPTQDESPDVLPTDNSSPDMPPRQQQQQSNGATIATNPAADENVNPNNHHESSSQLTSTPANANASTRDKQPKEREKKQPPVVSMFSTSSRDLDPYPLAGHRHRKSTPPQIEHYDGTNLSTTGGVRSSSVRPKSSSKHRTRSGSGKDVKP